MGIGKSISRSTPGRVRLRASRSFIAGSYSELRQQCNVRATPQKMTDTAQTRLRAVLESGVAGRTALKYLGETGAFVFHGSPDHLSLLRPRQARTYDVDTIRGRAHGPRGVSASMFPDVAIYRALLNPKVAPRVRLYLSEIDVDRVGCPRFAASLDAVLWATRPETVGWVHVLDRSAFRPFSRIEVRADHPVRPLAAICVSGLDMPHGIVVLPVLKREPEEGRAIS
jgi:hypothetical protein